MRSLMLLSLFVLLLQWADSGSLALIRLLMSHERAHLLIIGAYRSNEVDASHPLALLIAELQRAEASTLKLEEDAAATGNTSTSSAIFPKAKRVWLVELEPLSVKDVSHLVEDSFRCNSSDALALAQILVEKTGGNPFFCQTVLHSWHSSGLLTFNFSTARWEWQLDVLRREPISADVSDLVCRTMRTLSPHCQKLLKYAACCGHEVTLQLLRTVVPESMSLKDILGAVLALERSGLLICTSHSDDLALLTTLATSSSGSHVFTLHEAPRPGSSSSRPASKAPSAIHAAVATSSDSDTSPSVSDQISSNEMSGVNVSAPLAQHALLLSRLSVITLQFAHDKGTEEDEVRGRRCTDEKIWC
jgi:hypothetical protein